MLDSLSGEVIHPDDMADVCAAAKRACDAPHDALPEKALAHVRINSHSPWRETELKFSRDGEFLYATARDASEECRVETLLRAFLATASHDLRTPVGAMLSASALLTECLRVAQDAEATTLLASLRASCEVMLGTLSNLMDVRLPGALPDAGGKGEPVHAAATLRDVLHIASTSFGRPFAWINEAEAHSGPLASAVLLGDAAAVRLTMLNLAVACDRIASNDACCSVELQLQRQEDGRATYLELSYRAIASPYADLLDCAFDVFSLDGVGLALNAARRRARAVGGDVVVTSLPSGVLLHASLRVAVASGCPVSTEETGDGGVEDDAALQPAALGPPSEPMAGINVSPAQPQLDFTARMLEHLVRTSDDMYHVGTIGPGFDFQFAFVSPAVQTLFGFSPDDLVGNCPLIWTHPDDVPRCMSTFVDALLSLGGEGDEADQKPRHAVVSVPRRFRHRDGTYVSMITMGVVTRDRWCLTCKNVSSQFGRDEALRRLLLLLSRQLREPATAVLAAYELLHQRLGSAAAPDDDTALLLGSLGASCRMLLGFIDNALCAQAVQAGALTPRDISVPLDPAEALADVLRMCRLAYAPVQWDVDAARLPPLVRGVDRTLLCQILSNLAVNACKFEAGGGVSVRASVTMESDADGPCDLLVVVTDRGRGLSTIDAERLFEPYTSAAPVAQGGGAGLGLYVARTAARLMGGDVSLTSTALGRGTAFTLRLPVHVVHADMVCGADVAAQSPLAEPAPSTLPLPPSPPPSPIATLRCLLVDDHPLNLRLMSRLLLRAGFAIVDTAADGYEALAALHASFAAGTPPDAVMMDMQMPRMTGPESAAAFRAWETAKGAGQSPGARLPIVCVTANVLHKDHDECLAAGMDEVVLKPLQRRDVDSLLQRAMRHSRCKAAATVTAATTTARKGM